MMADELAKEVDFFSIGTNDLTQYTLAFSLTQDASWELAQLSWGMQSQVLGCPLLWEAFFCPPQPLNDECSSAPSSFTIS